MPGAGIFYVTDGISVARMVPGGALAAPSFYSPISCFPLLAPSAGLAFAGRQITYGLGADSSGAFAPPVIGSVGQSYTGNPAYGITLDGTINPDFSQVESDQFQIAVNQRYPLFFSEKRPFFMEGMGLFNVAHGDTMRTAVHTRRIVDPLFGDKLTGTAGKTTFGVLNALDDHPGDVGDRGAAYADRNKMFTVSRATVVDWSTVQLLALLKNAVSGGPGTPDGLQLDGFEKSPSPIQT